MIHYKINPQLALCGSVRPLRASVGVHHRPSVRAGIPSAFACDGAYDEDKLVGLIRAVGDGVTIPFIQIC